MVTILLAMTEKEIVQFFINQNNQIIGWFIGIIIGIFGILLAIFGLVQWHLSRVKVDDLKAAINDEYHLSKIKDHDKRITSLEKSSAEVMESNIQLKSLLNDLITTTTQNQQQMQTMNQNSLRSLISIHVTRFTDVVGNILTTTNLSSDQLHLQLTQIQGYLQTILTVTPSDLTLKIILSVITPLFTKLSVENLDPDSSKVLERIYNLILNNDNFKKPSLQNEYKAFIQESEYINTREKNE